MLFDVHVFIIGSAHLLLEEPGLQCGRRGSEDQQSHHIKIKLPLHSRRESKVILLGQFELVGKRAEVPTQSSERDVRANKRLIIRQLQLAKVMNALRM